MKKPVLPLHVLVLAVLLAESVFCGISMACGQGTEMEPNDSSSSAQDFGQVALPFTVTGSLDSIPGSPDIDFYRFNATPGDSLRVDLEGLDTEKGSLGDPFLGFFGSDGNLNALNDDVQNHNASLMMTVPSDGVFIMAVSSCCDGTFSGGGIGTYQLTLTSHDVIGSIGGRVVDAEMGMPPPDETFPFGFVELRRCDASGCVFENNTLADSSGRFQFKTDFYRRPLLAGTYQILVSNSQYQPNQTDLFEVGAWENHDVGDIPIQFKGIVNSISGRIVDAQTGEPLRKSTEVRLLICNEFCSPINDQYTDSEGRFRFVGFFYGSPLPAGRYQIEATSIGYQTAETDPFEVSVEENRDIGDFPMEPNPLQFTEIQRCDNLPPNGGKCRYSVRITNRMGAYFNGAAWSTVTAEHVGSYLDVTVFQTANPKLIALAPGASQVVGFEFDVPQSVETNALICTEALVGQNRLQPYFNTVARSYLFCFSKAAPGEISAVSGP